MKSTSGEYFIALDHIRALAAFLVFTWHFLHATNGYPIPFEYVPFGFIFSILDEGHTGVALFMTLSGYLFAKLLDGKHVNYIAFWWNRFLRLAPLLIFLMLITGCGKFLSGDIFHLQSNFISMVKQVVPNGSWSILVEFCFYLMLPLFFWLTRLSRLSFLILLLIALILRFLIFYERGGIQWLAYFTIVGRFDQFVLGILAYQYRDFIAKRHLLAIGGILAFLIFYWYFDLLGGFFHNPSYPSSSSIWIYLPTLEGIAYALVISYYDNSFSPSNKGISRLVSHIGNYSYSIYLLHFFLVIHLAQFIDEKLINISNFYLACLFSLISFLLMIPIAYLSYRFIESPFLRLRTPYLQSEGGRKNK
jgi:peptidoglycan/LPS O-acetylase OafA/YrhL